MFVPDLVTKTNPVVDDESLNRFVGYAQNDRIAQSCATSVILACFVHWLVGKALRCGKGNCRGADETPRQCDDHHARRSAARACYDLFDQLGGQGLRLAGVARLFDGLDIDRRIAHDDEADHAKAEMRGTFVSVDAWTIDGDDKLFIDLALPLRSAFRNDKAPARPGRESFGEVVSRCPSVEHFQPD